ncbi:MAG: hypothetical protein V4813_13030 [Gemmatimonadota bacterium]
MLLVGARAIADQFTVFPCDPDVRVDWDGRERLSAGIGFGVGAIAGMAFCG